MDASPLAVGGISLRLYPHDELGAVEQIAELRGQAALAADAGYDGVMVSEHHGGYPGYLPNPIQIATMLLPAMTRGWVAPCPLLLPMQPHALIAEQLAWLAACYPGRVGAGFAAGAVPVDFQLAEVPFDEITSRFKRALPLVVSALRGNAEGPLADDAAIRRCKNDPLPMVVAAQSHAAVRRAARLGLGVLYDSLQTPEATAAMSADYRAAGGTGPCILIRRVWIGDPPQAAVDAQMVRYRAHALDRVVKNWGTGSGVVVGASGAEAAASLVAAARQAGCDTINVRIYLAGLTPAEVRQQLALHAADFLPALRRIWPRHSDG